MRERPADTTPRTRISDRLARRTVLRLLRGVRGGQLALVEGDSVLSFGASQSEPSLRAVVEVRSPRPYRALLRGSVGLAESYRDRLWECADLVDLVRIAARNASWFDRLRRMLAPVLVPAQRWARGRRRNTVRRARRQIAAHYDLGNEFFASFLDPTMSYSCAIFPSPAASLEQASLAKLRRVCEKLALAPQDHLLEIGTGWGGLAVYAARNYGCRVTTATISREQHAYALARVREEGLSDRVTVLLRDYRDLRGRYDKLVSVEMIEAVGWPSFGAYFRRCSELLAADGLMLLQAITIDDEAYEIEKASRSFINTYIFPGGCLPSLKVISGTVGRFTDLRQVGLEDITSHYAVTLARWRERFLAAADRLAAAGYDERFRRLWELYLCWCEAGFRERRIQDWQVLLAKPGWPAAGGQADASAATARAGATA